MRRKLNQECHLEHREKESELQRCPVSNRKMSCHDEKNEIDENIKMIPTFRGKIHDNQSGYSCGSEKPETFSKKINGVLKNQEYVQSKEKYTLNYPDKEYSDVQPGIAWQRFPNISNHGNRYDKNFSLRQGRLLLRLEHEECYSSDECRITVRRQQTMTVPVFLSEAILLKDTRTKASTLVEKWQISQEQLYEFPITQSLIFELCQQKMTLSIWFEPDILNYKTTKAALVEKWQIARKQPYRLLIIQLLKEISTISGIKMDIGLKRKRCLQMILTRMFKASMVQSKQEEHKSGRCLERNILKPVYGSVSIHATIDTQAIILINTSSTAVHDKFAYDMLLVYPLSISYATCHILDCMSLYRHHKLQIREVSGIEEEEEILLETDADLRRKLDTTHVLLLNYFVYKDKQKRDVGLDLDYTNQDTVNEGDSISTEYGLEIDLHPYSCTWRTLQFQFQSCFNESKYFDAFQRYNVNETLCNLHITDSFLLCLPVKQLRLSIDWLELAIKSKTISLLQVNDNNQEEPNDARDFKASNHVDSPNGHLDDFKCFGIIHPCSEEENEARHNLPATKLHMSLNVCPSPLSDDHYSLDTKLVGNRKRFPFKKQHYVENFELDDVRMLRNVTWLPSDELPLPKIELSVQYVDQFPPLLEIITQIAEGNTPRPQISMRYELLRLCTLRTYPRENKPYLIKLAAAGFYYASDGDGVVCYCCGIRRYGWTEKDDPMAVHKRINQHCKFFKKNAEYNVPAIAFGPLSEKEAFLDAIPDCEVPNYSEDVNNDNDNNRQSGQPTTQNRAGLGVQTSMPKHPQYAPKTTRENSYNGWPNTSSHTPKELADAGFYFAGFGDCVRCFHCGIGLRHWDKEDNVWIEHARWSKDCVFLLQKKGREFVELVQLAVQYTNELEDQTGATGSSNGVVDLEKYLVGEAAQFVLTKGFTPIQIKESLEAILSKDSNAKITGHSLLQKVIELHGKKNESPPGDNSNSTPEPTESTQEVTEHQARGENTEAAVADPKAIKEENEQLKEQTVCKVCLDNTVSIVFLPCGHLVTCADCAPAMRKCPICRAVVKGTVRTYMS